MRVKNTAAILIFLFFCSLFQAAAQNSPNRAEILFQNGLTYFKNNDFRNSILTFRDIILDQTASELHGDAHFWTAKAYLAMTDLNNATKHLEFFILNFPENRHYPEGIYQKGRLLFLQNEYDSALLVFDTFIQDYSNSSFIANAYYWSGECLYALGHLPSAKKVFQHVVETFPTSFRVEAAKYRISLIDLKYREAELMKLLKWSHEESLRALNEYKKNEQTYEEALESYQTKLSNIISEDFQGEITRLTENIKTLSNEKSDLAEDVETLQTQVEDLQSKIQEKESEIAALRSSASTRSGTTTASSTSSNANNMMKLLNLKNQALELKGFYQDWLQDNRGN